MQSERLEQSHPFLRLVSVALALPAALGVLVLFAVYSVPDMQAGAATGSTGDALSLGAARPASPLSVEGSGFTYQGQLQLGGAPANGQFDLIFSLYDAATGGNLASAPITLTNQTVSSGLFTASLDFGQSVFYGDGRWLQIAIRSSGGGSFTTLSPRQPITPAPFALSSTWQGTSGKPFPYNPLPQPDMLTTIGPAGPAGGGTSITVGVDGFGLLVYHDPNGHLRVAHCSNVACTSATATTIDASSTVGYFPSVTLGSDGLGLIAYGDNNSGSLKVAHCSNVACTSATIATIDPNDGQGGYTSVTVGSNGLGLISYLDGINLDLRVAHCFNLLCSVAQTSIVDGVAGEVGYDSSITTNGLGLGMISYYDYTNGHLKVASCNDSFCSSSVTYTVDSSANVGERTSITLGSDGLALVSYYDVTNGHLKVAHCTYFICNAATVSTVDFSAGVGAYTSVTVGPDGLGLITYYDTNQGAVKVAHCYNLTCTSAGYTFVDAGNVGNDISITLGADGLGLIAYYDGTNHNLKVAHCASPLCVSYQHRR
jgi:hypothetical protein